MNSDFTLVRAALDQNTPVVSVNQGVSPCRFVTVADLDGATADAR